MSVVFDNIIFSLQKAGGISVVWQELIKRILKDSDINVSFIEQYNENIFRKKLQIPEELIIHNNFSKLPISFQRYLNPRIRNESGIFHSSYYRTTSNPNLINISTVHDFTYEYYRKGLPKLIHQKQKVLAINKSKKIICVSNNTKKDLLKFYPNIQESCIEVIYNGVDSVFKPIIDKPEKGLKDLIHFSSRQYAL